MSDTPAFPTSTQVSQNNTTGETTSYQYLSDGMSLREYAAIKLKVPESGTDWLDDMIRKSLRDDMAMSVNVKDPGYAYHFADKFLAARGGDK